MNHLNKHLAGIDIGTTGAKTIIFDLDGNKIAGAYREYPCHYPRPNWVEQDSDLLVAASMDATREVMEAAGIAPASVAAVSFSTQRTCTHFLDENGRLVRPMISWQDNRPVEELAYLQQKLGAGRFHALNKLPPGAIWIVNKILWLRNHEPEHWSRVRHIVQLQDYFLRAYGAEGFWTDTSDAGLFGCRDLYGNRWSDEICRALEIDTAMLPKVAPSGTVVGNIGAAVAAKTGLAEGTPIVVGAGDQNAAAIGAGLIEPGMMSVSLGTGGLAAAFVEGELPALGEHGMLTAHPMPGKYMLEGYQPAGASSLRWFRDEISRCWFRQGENLPPCTIAAAQHVDVYEILDHIAEGAPAGCKGLVVNPYFASAGTPRWNADARAVITGLTFAHGRACLVRAFMEGITLDVKDMINSMSGCGVPIETVRILGGPTKSELWNQIQADVYGRPVSTLKVTDAAPLGAAICAGVGVGLFPDIPDGVRRMVRINKTYQPIAENVAVYEELYGVFCDIYEAMSSGAFARLAKFQNRCGRTR
jgi:xylulokinase